MDFVKVFLKYSLYFFRVLFIGVLLYPIAPAFSKGKTERYRENASFFYIAHIDFSSVEFEEKLLYQKMYESSSLLSTIEYQWMFSTLVDLGISMRIGSYSDEGFALKKDRQNVDESQSLHLFLLPIQTSLHISFSKIFAYWLHIDGWYGYEYLYFYEQKNSQGAEEKQVSYFKDWKMSYLYGVSIGILLNEINPLWIEKLYQYSGIYRIYLYGRYNVVRQIEKTTQYLNRKELGVGISFVGDF